MEKETVTVNGIEYSIGEMPVFDQFHVGRRLAPFLGSALEAFRGQSLDTAAEEFDILLLATPSLTKTLAEMKDEDAEYIIRKCLSVVKRHEKSGWAKVMNGAGNFQFQDIDLKAMLTLTTKVIQENIGDFFPTSQPTSQEPV